MQRLNIYRRLAMYAEERGRIMQALMYTKQVNNLLDSLSLKYNIEIEDRMRALYTRQYETKTEMDKSFQNERKDENGSMRWLAGLPDGGYSVIGKAVLLLYGERNKPHCRTCQCAGWSRRMPGIRILS